MSDSGPCVAVLGAGLAGLGAAWRLARRGCEVVVLERRDRAGGRFSALWVDGWSADRSLPVVAATDRNLLGWIGELGLAQSLLPLRPLRLEQVRNGQRAAIDPTTLAGVARIPGLRFTDAMRALRLARLHRRYHSGLDSEAPERASRWDDRSVADFARLYFGRRAFERWIGPAVTSQALGDAEELSRVLFLLQGSRFAAGTGLPGVPRRGIGDLARTAADRLGVRLGVSADRVEARAARGFRLLIRSGERGEDALDVDAVVVATAASEAARLTAPLLTPAERDFLMDVSYVPALTLSVALERPLGSAHRLVRVPHVESSPIEVALLDPGEDGSRAPKGRGLVTLAATAQFGRRHIGATEEVSVKSLRSALEKLEPGVKGEIRFASVERTLVPHFGVGAYRNLDRFARVQRDRRGLGRRLYFAGDHLCGPTAENALVSGLRAARALLEDFG